MEKTKIEWCDSTWNPVTGCYHQCPYCYARSIAERFKGCDAGSTYGAYHQATWRRINPDSPLEQAIFEVDAKCPPINITFDAAKQVWKHSVAPYPWGFKPTLRRDHLNDFVNKKSRTIFVCSMADLFGEWVPDSWIEEVFVACKAAPQHRYLFLTKNPQRYINLSEKGILPEAHEQPNFWFGTSVTDGTMLYFWSEVHNTFISVEPILASFAKVSSTIKTDWVIIGAETGTRRDRVVPKYEWVINLRNECWQQGKSVFMKDSLIPIVGEEDMSRELPWDRKTYRR